MYIAVDEFLKSKEDNGLFLFDRASERHISTHARKLLGTGSSGVTIPGVRIGWIIDDPIFRVSADSIFNADKIFVKKLLSRFFKSSIGDENGIIRA